jgi:hypothetical protein
MTDKAQLAAEAQRIKENEALQLALSQIRSEALEGLVRTPATDIEAIRDHQAVVRVVDDFLARIEATIRNGQPRKQAGIV